MIQKESFFHISLDACSHGIPFINACFILHKKEACTWTQSADFDAQPHKQLKYLLGKCQCQTRIKSGQSCPLIVSVEVTRFLISLISNGLNLASSPSRAAQDSSRIYVINRDFPQTSKSLLMYKINYCKVLTFKFPSQSMFLIWFVNLFTLYMSNLRTICYL